MIRKTEGIVLRMTAYSRTSRIISWLTPVHGRIVTIAKGSQRPKSLMLGQYDLFYTCEILFYERERANAYILKECYPINVRPGIRGNWKATACASYVCDIASRILPLGGHGPEIFSLVECGLNFVSACTPSQVFIHWFELQLMRATGVSPQLTSCPVCHCDLATAPGRTYFAISKGGILCQTCASATGNASAPVGPDVAAILRTWQACPAPTAAQRVNCSERQLSEIEGILAAFLRYHLDTLSPATRIVTKMLAKNSPDARDARA